MKFKRMSEVDLRGKRVFIRCDLNVPIEDGRITDDTRIRASVPGIKHALDQGAAVMVTSHLGRPTEGVLRPEDSLLPVARRLSELLKKDVPLMQDWVNGVDVKPGQVVMLENCRVNKGEKSDDAELARKIATLCDVYVNDAFGTAHRAEATTHGVARFAKVACAGPLMAAELDALGKALASPARPLIAIVGGSKVSTKLTVLAELANKVDSLIVGGGIANTFLLEYAHRSVPDDGAGFLELRGESLGRLRTDVQDHLVLSDRLDRLGLAAFNHHIAGQRDPGLLHDALRLASEVGLGERPSDRLAGGEKERVGDAAADDQAVDLVRELGQHR